MDFRDDAPPWSFFLPMTLAVIVGVLAADAIRFAAGTVLGGSTPSPSPGAHARAEAAANAAAEAAAARESGRPAPGTTPATATSVQQEGGTGGVPVPAAATDVVAEPGVDGAAFTSGVQELPDSMTARRDGEPAACVNGTVVQRVEGGWEQVLEHDAPVACVTVHR